ncbi:uncharacterized protein CEXT_207601 [Caerostris extrusa]|uniref:Uncharacterized protein n=1 Tax=Caerostris extrusa TaxID=172846 RepID=A0AAV4XW83_CAEEX|nr:uncharacterized protein CEXT_207601 [Caerostris extrusa]
MNFNSKIKALSPVKDERFHNAKGKIFEAKTPNCGVESFISLKKSVGRIKKVKRPSTDKIHTFHDETELDQVKMKVNNTNEKHIVSHKSSHSVSPPDKVQKAAIVNAIKSPVDESIKYNLPDITSVLPKHLTKETNLKIQPEVAFDENQSANTISISASDQQNQNKQSPINEIDGMKEIIELKHKTCDTYENIDIYKSSESWELDLNQDAILNLITNPLKKKSEILLESTRFALLQVELNFAFDPQLLKALDLHDTLYNRINNPGYIQSRSSIEPLNLCFRDIGYESERNPCLIETESKENIPTLYSSKIFEKKKKKFQIVPRKTKDSH